MWALRVKINYCNQVKEGGPWLVAGNGLGGKQEAEQLHLSRVLQTSPDGRHLPLLQGLQESRSLRPAFRACVGVGQGRRKLCLET